MDQDLQPFCEDTDKKHFYNFKSDCIAKTGALDNLRKGVLNNIMNDEAQDYV